MKEEQKTQKTELMDKIKKQVEEKIKTIADNGIKSENLDNLYKLIDIHKDIANEEYWKVEKEGEMSEMRYGNYGEYNGYYGEDSYGRRMRDSRGRYMEGNSYGRRGVKGTGRGRYRGEEKMDEMMYHYGNYNESGQYGAEHETMESLSALMESAYEYFKDLKENANSPEEIKMMEHYFKKMGQM